MPDTRFVGSVISVDEHVPGETRAHLVYSKKERFDGTSPGILFFGGATPGASQGSAFVFIGNLVLDLPYLPMAVLANRGFIVLSAVWGAPVAWGNDTQLAAIEAGYTALMNMGAKPGKIGLWGGSMGATSAARYWAEEPDNVGGVLLEVPAVNTPNVYNDVDSTTQAGMDAAWGGDFLTNGAPFSPHLITPNDTTPLDVRYGESDALIRSADVIAYANAFGGTATAVNEVTGASGHGVWRNPDQPDILVFDSLKD